MRRGWVPFIVWAMLTCGAVLGGVNNSETAMAFAIGLFVGGFLLGLAAIADRSILREGK